MALATDVRTDAPKNKEQTRSTTAPAMPATPHSVAALNGLLTEFLNETAVRNGAAPISGQMHGFGLGFHVIVEERHVLPAEDFSMIEIIDERFVPPVEDFREIEFIVYGEECAEDFDVIAKSTPKRKPRRVRLSSSVKLVNNGTKARSGGSQKQKGKQHVRSGAMDIDFEIVEERDVEKGRVGQRKARFYAFYLRRLGLNGRRLRFSQPDEHGYVTVMKGAKRYAERKVKIPSYSATYSGKGISHKTSAKSARKRQKDAAQYDRQLRSMIDRRAEQRAVETMNRKAKQERKLKAGVKRSKEEFE